MKICPALLGAVFTFIAIECQAATKSYTTADIFIDGGWLGTPKVNVAGFRTKYIEYFDIDTTAVLTPDQRKSFVKNLFASDDQDIIVTPKLVKMLATGLYFREKHKTNPRAVAFIAALQAVGGNIYSTFDNSSNQNKVFIFNRRQRELDGSAAEGARSPLKRKSSFTLSSPTKINGSDTPTLSVFTLLQDDIEVIEERLGVFNAKKNAVPEESKMSVAGGGSSSTPSAAVPKPVAPVKSAEQLEQEEISNRWTDFLTSYYAADLASKVDDVLDFASGMTASTFLIKPTTLAEAEERIRAATEYYNQELLRNIDEVRSLRTQIESASITVSEIDTMLTELGYDVSSLTSLDGKERVKEAMLALKTEGSDFEAALAKNTSTMKDLRSQIELERRKAPTSA